MLVIQFVAAATVLAALGGVASPAGTPSAAMPQSSGQTLSSPATAAEPSAQAWQDRKAFDGVFGTPRKAGPRIEFTLSSPWGKADGPKVICGTVVLRPDPTMDPKMRVAKPLPDIEYKMRLVPPVLCRG